MGFSKRRGTHRVRRQAEVEVTVYKPRNTGLPANTDTWEGQEGSSLTGFRGSGGPDESVI